MQTSTVSAETLSPWWRHAVILTLIGGFTVLIWLAARSYSEAPPIPETIQGPAGEPLFTKADIVQGQHVFLKYGLMDNGSIWGHGAYLGPDFSAAYLHHLVDDTRRFLAQQRTLPDSDGASSAPEIAAETRQLLKQNRYEPTTRTLTFTVPEAMSFNRQLQVWREYFTRPGTSRGLPAEYISDATEIRQLTAFFSWTAWASVAQRPGSSASYTNNFPYEPEAGNTPTGDALLWSALSLIALLAGIAGVLFAFGKFDFLGWKGVAEHVHPQMLPGALTPSQRATLKYFVLVTVLFLAQAMLGGATAHYRADPGSFYGFDLASILPSHLARTWHLQLAVFWVATAYVAGGLLLAHALGSHEPTRQVPGIHLLFGALLLVVGGSMLGELLGLKQLLGNVWYWLGHQGWEYLELGRLWQMLLALGLVLWLVLLFRAVAPARQLAEGKEIAALFLYAAVAIPVFYLPAMFFDGSSHFSVVDTWRFWIIHLWVEGFFELFVTVMVAVIFYKLGLITPITATRVVYLDAILYLGGGIIGTGHHWYWTGQPAVTMALGAMFSALEVVPLTLLTLDAWDFIKLTRSDCEVCGQSIAIPHKWTFYFLIAVGFWNFVGAGIFGFLINLPIVSYFEVGTLLTPNHGHTAMMGVFGMLAMALTVFALRQAAADALWPRLQRYIRVSFWGLNTGLALMAISNLFPGGVLQLMDVLQHGYWHARSAAFLNQRLFVVLEWLRLPGDLVFIVLGILPMVCAALWCYLAMRPGRIHRSSVPSGMV
jgi:nitric oxide reductase subunit B